MVVAVLAIAMTIAVPPVDAISPAAADAAAGEVAQALRFARREAMRTRAYHAASFDPLLSTLRVYRLSTVDRGVEDTGQPVLHPVDRRVYRIAFSEGAGAQATIASANFKYDKNLVTRYAVFGPDGRPADVHGLQVKDAKPLMEAGLVTVRHGRVERTVSLEPDTGRVVP